MNRARIKRDAIAVSGGGLLVFALAGTLARLPAALGNQTAQKMVDWVYTPSDPMEKACALAIRAFKTTGKIATIPVEQAEHPNAEQPTCTVGITPKF